ncbi:MAG TPA: exodeoxyribonuclease VII large subunit [Candidatus Eisenbacteria bacterium]|nr:exodeoxyribonuclease VII large subunit [Candidatus Eisenbacteria bacterium]
MSDEAIVYTVSEIAGALRRTLESGYHGVRIRGEISNLRLTPSGHRYFVLKDDRAQLRAVFFRGDALSLRFTLSDGLEVEARGDITVYETRGELQLVVRRLWPSGIGALLLSLEQLRKRLAAEGLFDATRKRSLPVYPRVIGLVTSPTGAAVRDILKVLRRRWPVAQIVLHPVPVQGEGAAGEIVRALDRMNRWGKADVIILGRGGGSLEDLWAFNEEPVVRAVASSRIPIISAVGHETDITLCDLAADMRAPTPSAAAEIAAPNIRDLVHGLEGIEALLDRRMRDAVGSRRAVLSRLARAYGFRRPERFLERSAERVDDAALRLERGMRALFTDTWRQVTETKRRLAVHHPALRLAHAAARFQHASLGLDAGMRRNMGRRRERVEPLSRALRALDPTQVLRRGYCLARDPRTTHLVTEAAALDPGAPVVIQFLKDRLHARVETQEPGGPWSPSGSDNGERG